VIEIDEGGGWKKEEKITEFLIIITQQAKESSCKMKWLFATKINIGYNVPPPLVISPTPQSLTLFAFSSRGNAGRGEETLGTRARNLSSYRERRKRVLGIVRVLAPSLSTLTHPFVVVYIHTGALVCFVVPLVYISPLQGRPGQQHKIEMLFFFLDSSTPLPNEIFFFHQCPNKLFCLYIIDCVCVCVSISSGSVAKDSICTPAAASLLLLLLLR
jgi:hypothetical protein